MTVKVKDNDPVGGGMFFLFIIMLLFSCALEKKKKTGTPVNHINTTTS